VAAPAILRVSSPIPISVLPVASIDVLNGEDAEEPARCYEIEPSPYEARAA
jgi:hypothetical protein